MEVAMFPTPFYGPVFRRVSMIVVLGVRLRIVDVSRGIVVPFEKFSLAAKKFTDHIGIALLQNSIAFENLISGRGHGFETVNGKLGQLRHEYPHLLYVIAPSLTRRQMEWNGFGKKCRGPSTGPRLRITPMEA